MAEMKELEDKNDKAAYSLTKFTSLVHSQEKDSDEKSADVKFRAAARSWRQLFRMPDSERLVSFYSCSYHRKLMNQGWLYVSPSYCCFYSFVLGTETKVVIELKDIEELCKEKSKRGMVSDSIRIVTKNKTEHFFSNLFQRDETFELLEYLTNVALQKLLKATSTDPAPGLSLKSQESQAELLTSPAAILGLTRGNDTRPLKELFELQRRNAKFQWLFNLPTSESIVEDIHGHLLHLGHQHQLSRKALPLRHVPVLPVDRQIPVPAGTSVLCHHARRAHQLTDVHRGHHRSASAQVLFSLLATGPCRQVLPVAQGPTAGTCRQP
ncbi:hypothetical protein BC831DRAFT_200802 [Entophlyctis helioformis]|nr:hypothetical protein BC831DRAFT_200802 [Entophlyctis helioformis]